MSGGICPWGKFPGGTCPGGYVLEPYRIQQGTPNIIDKEKL